MHEKEAKTILSTQNGMNPYCGCTCGCLVCAARGACRRKSSAFDDVEIRANAPALLETALRRKRSRCMIVTGAMGDPYQVLEEERKLMRSCLEVIDRCGFGVSVETRSPLITRDLDLLESIGRKSRCVVVMGLSTMDPELSGKIEEGVSSPEERLRAIEALRDAGIPVIVRLDPVLPFVNDSRENLKEVLEACVGASVYGVRLPGPGILLRAAERERFYQKLGEKFPGLPERYRAVYGDAGELMIPHFEELEKYLRGICAGCRMECSSEKLFRWQHAFVDRQAGVQMNLFDLYPEAMRMPQK